MTTTMVALHGSIESAGVMQDKQVPDTEVPPKATRRRFPAEYKARILAEYERLPDGEKGALLRREGLYSSLISEWRKQAAAGAVEGLATKRGRPGRDARDRKIAELEAENERLRQRLETSEKVIEVQGKVSALLEHISESAETETNSKP
jgi:transposase-like protein